MSRRYSIKAVALLFSAVPVAFCEDNSSYAWSYRSRSTGFYLPLFPLLDLLISPLSEKPKSKLQSFAKAEGLQTLTMEERVCFIVAFAVSAIFATSLLLNISKWEPIYWILIAVAIPLYYLVSLKVRHKVEIEYTAIIPTSRHSEIDLLDCRCTFVRYRSLSNTGFSISCFMRALTMLFCGDRSSFYQFAFIANSRHGVFHHRFRNNDHLWHP